MLVLTLLPILSAVEIENQTITYSSLSNSTIRWEQDTTLDLLIVNGSMTRIYNLSTNGSIFTNINQTYNAQLNFYGLPNNWKVLNLTNNEVLFTSDGITDDYNVIFAPNIQIQVINYSVITPGGSITGTSPITYNTASGVTGSESNLYDEDVVYSLYRNGTSVSNPDTSVLAVNFYSYIYNSTAGVNYSANASIDTFDLIINKATPVGAISGTASIVNGTAADVTATESNTGDNDLTYLLYRNGTTVSNPDESSPVTGFYSYIYNTTGGSNYTSSASLATFTLTVTPSTDYSRFTLDMVQILQMLIIFSMVFVVMMSVRRVWMGEMNFGELFTLLVIASFIFIIFLFLAPIAVSYIADLIN